MCVAGAAALQLLQVGDARELAVEAIQARLKLLLDAGQHAALQRRRPPAPGASMPSSASVMLRESSTRKTMMSCCGLSSVIVTAGCHSRSSSTRGEHRLQQPDAGRPQLRDADVARRQAARGSTSASAGRRRRDRQPTASTPATRRAGRSALAKTSRADT